MSNKLVLDNISKTYNDGDSLATTVLDQVSIQVKAGELVAVVGPSGSGKSTFLSIAGALLSPTNGKILIDDIEISNLPANKLNEFRLSKIGFIFQMSNLIPYLTVKDQLLLIAELAGIKNKIAEKKANELLEQLGLSKRMRNYPENLSGGERQRVAIARALMNDPEVIFADEPTASLDSERGRAVVEMLSKEVKQRQKAAIMVTHDKRMLDLCDRVVYIENGKLTEQI
ncbi:ABC transporter ATP-binding protein [Gottfriedia acidiceleris]|uniref:ABC transporter ATP-binding protein n=1 Tax=Bacillaceae TaxID=186817 RepID=UPI000BEE4DF4|nr:MULTISPECIES: ABC transporter ATP-binding protein [unclassified Bacillus (in: firmicutes)]PEC49325.1 hemin ABC transporter ATP-binding protein [Bacillus sp. AFS096315]PFM82430.1 hemin ABC transporter ATP-binding protein [Bacillus sp. AFS077874]